MPVESDSKVREMKKVQDGDGNAVPPASDAETHVAEQDIDIYNDGAGKTVAITGPSRASTLTLHVEPDTDAKVSIHFLDSEGGTRITSRTPTENDGFSSAGGADIFGKVTALSSRYIEVDIEDASGGANTANYCLRVV
jgi:hypothetical protein